MCIEAGLKVRSGELCQSYCAMWSQSATHVSIVFHISAIFGSSSLLRTSSGHYQFFWFLLFYTIALALITTAAGFYWLHYLTSNYSMSSSLFLDLTYSILNNLAWFIIVHQSLIKSSLLSDIIEELKKLNGSLDEFKYGEKYISLFILLIVLNVIHKIAFLTKEWNNMDWTMGAKILFDFFVINTSVVLMGQYAVLMKIVGDQLKQITDDLNEATFSSEVRHIAQMHKALCMIAIKINSVYNLFLLVALSIPFLITTLEVYGIIVWLIKPNAFYETRHLMIAFFNVIAYAATVFTITSVSSYAERQSKIFNTRLFKSLLYAKTLSRDPTLQVYLSMRYEIKQTACDFFSLGYPMLTSMIAAAVTYVVMLIQFVK